VFALLAIWLLGGLTVLALYQWTPLRSLVSASTLTDFARPLAQHPAAPILIAATYFCSVFVAFPRAALTVPAVVVFGPWVTFFGGMAGLLLGAVCGFSIGHKLTGEKLRSLAVSPLLRRVEEKLRFGGIAAVVVVRLVPLAPFTVVNMIFGVLRVRMGDFVSGTFLGLLPGFLLSVFMGDRMRIILSEQHASDLLVLGLQMAAAGFLLYCLWRIAAATFRGEEICNFSTVLSRFRSDKTDG
jgi:phospholipase D1/2